MSFSLICNAVNMFCFCFFTNMLCKCLQSSDELCQWEINVFMHAEQAVISATFVCVIRLAHPVVWSCCVHTLPHPFLNTLNETAIWHETSITTSPKCNIPVPFRFLPLFREGCGDVFSPFFQGGYWGQIQLSMGEGQGTPLDESPAHCRTLTDGSGCQTRCQLHIRSNFGVQYLAQRYFDM